MSDQQWLNWLITNVPAKWFSRPMTKIVFTGDGTRQNIGVGSRWQKAWSDTLIIAVECLNE